MAFISQTILVEALAFTVSLVLYKYLSKGKLKTLPFYLGFILLVELTGRYIGVVLHKPNGWLYNPEAVIEYLYYLYLFSKNGGILLKQVARLAIVVFGVTAIYYFLTMPIKNFYTDLFTIGNISVVLCSCLYFYYVFSYDDDRLLTRRFFFWIASGLLLFGLTDAIYLISFRTIKALNLDPTDSLYKLINNNVLLLLYSSFIISMFVYRKNEQY